MNAIETVEALIGHGLVMSEPQQAGALTLLPLHHAGPALGYAPYPDIALDPEFTVQELAGGAAVPTLLVANGLAHDVLIPEGQVLVGLQQDRTLNVTVLVPAHATTEIPVSCVERGRWHASGDVASSADAFLSPRVRDAKLRGVQRNLAESGVYHSEQGRVWHEVDRMLRSTGSHSPSDSYNAVYQTHRGRIDEIVNAFTLQPDQRGVFALIGDRPVALDVFDSPRAMGALWRPLLRSYAAESLRHRRPAGDRAIDDSVAWIRSLTDGTAVSSTGVGLGEIVQFETADSVTSALVYDGAVVHMAALGIGSEPSTTQFTQPSARRAWHITS